jgi:indolepyruvate ferredoxin oxidoreductase, beta subunit
MRFEQSTLINLIITGVGGQGNILISKLLGEAFVELGRTVTIGETYGATQRGGSVASHVRISTEKIPYSPVTPRGKADIVLGLEPSESIRMLTAFGHTGTYVATNTRPVHSLEVAIGEADYPSPERIRQCINSLSRKAWYIDASDHALSLGNALLTNIVMLGSLFGTDLLPLDRTAIEAQLRRNFVGQKLAVNLKAFELGYADTKQST